MLNTKCTAALIAVLCILITPAPLRAEADPEIGEVGSVPNELRERFELDPFYQKYLACGPLPILGSANVSDFALREAAWIVHKVIGHRPDILQAMADNGVRMVIMAYNEYTTDLPEQANMQPKDYWDRRARGLGGQIVSGAEENLLCYPNDPYSTENILIHEFAHTIHGSGLRARRIGAFSGAMQWCSTLQPAHASRYRLAGQRARNAMHLLPGHQRRLAHETRDHTRRSGRFMGARLDYRQCQQLERNTRPW